MAGSLSNAAVSDYERNGVLFPVRVMAEAEAGELRRRMEDCEARRGRLHYTPKPHLVLPFVAELVRHAAILDAVESLVGSDILLWDSSFIVKEPGDGKRVSWHQDLTYWGLEPTESVVSIWLALAPATVESGAMKMIPGSHLGPIRRHRDTFAADNILTRGQEIAEAIDESRAVDIVLAPGEMSLHHGRIFHGSQPNRSADRRIGFNAQYIAARARQVVGRWDSATLVRGRDTHGHFAPEPRPVAEYDPACVGFQEEMAKRRKDYIYAGAGSQ
jgi:ectoine hydroxylase-related dioxygenase (phytanoyl-CoA dioxygenase family)